ncbi:purine permease [Nonomuraea sp. MG754425]|uniref:nucleobase:cation symporter-2 family protein n=1 Tax=Nonomuraea sp. MG754425 TaxID=2570319 RepID=UPI001F2273BC|nr:nucleobase:cation symporter-2 family protein [Nonomuraea sp. MG754425]MCF6475451.1 purine permease [Nonomuraea sp. MG754425]
MKTEAHPVDARLPAAQLGTLGLQHVLAMYAGAVAVPLIVGGALKLPPEQLAYLINADLLISGIATLIQCVGVWRFGIRLPIMQGCTFAAVTPMVLIGTTQGGLPAIYGAVIVSGLLVVAVAPFFAKIVRFFPPLVTGTIITIIGISLLPVAARWAAGDASGPGHGQPRNIAMAAAVLLFILAVQRLSKGFLGRVAVLAGIAAGTLAAIPLGFTDFSNVGSADLFGISTPFAFGVPTFQLTAIISMCVVMLVSMTETTGDFVAVAEMTGSRLTPRRLADGLRADGFSTALGGVFNTFPYTAFAQNVGLVGLTGVRSRWVVATAGGILVVLGLIPVLGAVIAAIPAPVLGGAGIVMFGTVAASGIRTLSKVSFEGNHNLVIVAVSIGVAAIPVGAPDFYERFPDWAQTILNSGISTGSLLVIVLNLVFNHLRPNPPAPRS